MTGPTLASGAALAGSLVAVLLGLVVRRATRVRVSGPSMQPTYHDGDRLLVWRTRRVRAGQVVVVHDPRGGDRLWVKRVSALTADGVDIRGDDPAHSTDSRHVGPVPRRLIVGRVVHRYAVTSSTTRPPPPG